MLKLLFEDDGTPPESVVASAFYLDRALKSLRDLARKVEDHHLQVRHWEEMRGEPEEGKLDKLAER